MLSKEARFAARAARAGLLSAAAAAAERRARAACRRRLGPRSRRRATSSSPSLDCWRRLPEHSRVRGRRTEAQRGAPRGTPKEHRIVLYKHAAAAARPNWRPSVLRMRRRWRHLPPRARGGCAWLRSGFKALRRWASTPYVHSSRQSGPQPTDHSISNPRRESGVQGVGSY